MLQWMFFREARLEAEELRAYSRKDFSTQSDYTNAMGRLRPQVLVNPTWFAVCNFFQMAHVISNNPSKTLPLGMHHFGAALLLQPS